MAAVVIQLCGSLAPAGCQSTPFAGLVTEAHLYQLAALDLLWSHVAAISSELSVVGQRHSQRPAAAQLMSDHMGRDRVVIAPTPSETGWATANDCFVTLFPLVRIALL